jgi:Rab-3A-interacting protein
MPRNQQPLFDILNQPVQDGTGLAVLTNKSGSLRTQAGQISPHSQAQNIITSSHQTTTVHNTSCSLPPARRLSDTSSSFSDQETKLDVSMRREQFSVTGRSERLESDNISGSPDTREILPTSDVRLQSHGGPNQECNNNVPDFSLASEIGQLITNSNGKRVNEQKFDSTDSGFPSPSDAVMVEDDCSVKRHHQHYPFRQAYSEVILPSAVQRRMSLVNVKERGYARLQDELMRAQKALERKDEEVGELRGIRERLMQEVSDFTAALFEEVNSQLNEAALSEQFAKKQLKEATEKIEILTAEVTALKDLVLTSTPSSPNKHLHPQIARKEKDGKPFWKTHRRSTSHHQFTKESREMAEATDNHSLLKELDTVVFDEFKRWLLQPTMEFSGLFFDRVQQEDIEPCLSFRNTKLADKVLESVMQNTLSIEPIPGDQSFPRKCSLSESHKLCNYKIKFEGGGDWYSISQMSRNRIAAVCDFYSYLRYIVQGLVKCSDKDIFAELVRLRSQMAQARLGLI